MNICICKADTRRMIGYVEPGNCSSGSGPKCLLDASCTAITIMAGREAICSAVKLDVASGTANGLMKGSLFLDRIGT